MVRVVSASLFGSDFVSVDYDVTEPNPDGIVWERSPEFLEHELNRKRREERKQRRTRAHRERAAKPQPPSNPTVKVEAVDAGIDMI